MSGALAELHFLRPLCLLGLLLLPLLARWLTRPPQADPAWRAACDAHLLPHLMAQSPQSGRGSRWLALTLWTLACVALAGPAWERAEVPLYRGAAARVIVLALTPSMLSADLKPTRLDRARYKIADLLRQNDDTEVALIAYAGDAFVVAPLTDDVATVAHLLEALDPTVMPVAGARADRALKLAGTLLARAGHVGGDVLLVADAADSASATAAAKLRSSGIAVSVLGVGTAEGAPVVLPGGGFMKDSAGNILLPKLDAAALSAVASAGGGDYATLAVDGSDLARVTASFGVAKSAERADQALSERFQDRGPWLLLLLVPLALACFRRGWLMVLPLAVLLQMLPTTAMAIGWDDLWSRRDQQADALLRKGDAEAALKLADDPGLLGAAAYRKGDFARAAEEFKSRSDAEAQYNLGNALAKQARYEEALAAYGEALEKQPDLADAIANKQAIEDWLKQQQQQQDQQQQQSSESKSQDGEQQQEQSAADKDQQSQPQDAQDQQAQQDQQESQDSQEKQGQQGQQNQQEQKDQQAQQGENSAEGQPKDSKDASAAQQDQQAQEDAEQSATEPTEQESAAEEEKRAAEEFSRQMGQALANKPESTDQEGKPAEARAVVAEAPPSEEAQATEQWLQRIPDDPGGLLRRKFQLEHQRRQKAGGEDDRP